MKFLNWIQKMFVNVSCFPFEFLIFQKKKKCWIECLNWDINNLFWKTKYFSWNNFILIFCIIFLYEISHKQTQTNEQSQVEVWQHSCMEDIQTLENSCQPVCWLLLGKKKKITTKKTKTWTKILNKNTFLEPLEPFILEDICLDICNSN